MKLFWSVILQSYLFSLRYFGQLIYLFSSVILISYLFLSSFIALFWLFTHDGLRVVVVMAPEGAELGLAPHVPYCEL